MKLKIVIFTLGLFLFNTTVEAQSCKAIIDAGLAIIDTTLNEGLEELTATITELSSPEALEKAQNEIAAAAEGKNTPAERRLAIAEAREAYRERVAATREQVREDVAMLVAEIESLREQLLKDLEGCSPG